MFRLRRPSEKVIGAFLEQQSDLAFTYPGVGGTASTPPVGFQRDHSRFELGAGDDVFGDDVFGDDVFEKAKAALRGWKQFELGWAYARPDDTPIRPEETVAVFFHTFGLWTLCAARIVYVIDEPNRFGFAYGTLPGHVEAGEERFLVERMSDGTVWYDVLAFSRPRHILARLGSPIVRRLQQRFVRESGKAMQAATRLT